jgi:hypothetical protein
MNKCYLEFNELDDYIAYLRGATHEETPLTYVDITSVSGTPDKYGIREVAYYAALTRPLVDGIATTAILLLRTTNFRLRTEHDAMNALHEHFDKVLTMLRERGLVLERGKWTAEPPAYLSAL